MTSNAYKGSGVDIDAATRAVELMKAYVRSTFTSSVISDIGLFSGLFTIPELKKYKEPVFAGSTDGVGTKMMIAERMGKFDTIGQCLANHCVNDILTSGAKPLAFFDYTASLKLIPAEVADIVKGIATACREVDCALVGGETAEMPGVYRKGRHDLVGTIFGIVEREKVIDGSRIAEGDLLLGLPSSGLHTNGYSLVRKAIKTAGLKLNQYIEELGCTLGEELLRVHKCYFSQVYPLAQEFNLGGVAHITGGGLIDNIARLLPDSLCAKIDYDWPIPAIFKMVQEIENVSWPEMRKTFNLGVGMVLIVSYEESEQIREALGDDHWLIGEICLRKEGEDKVVFS